MNRFLPSPAPGNNYPLADPDPHNFSRQDATLIRTIGRQMWIAKAASEGRVPSPLSPAYMFYWDLYPHRRAADAAQAAGTEGGVQEAREDLEFYHQKATGAFRGLCATFALRQVLGLDIELSAVDPANRDPGADPMGIGQVLADCRHTAPGATAFWQTIRYYTVCASDGTREVLAGLSPLTGFFPAASQMQQFTPVFWYGIRPDNRTRLWYDPTTEFNPQHPQPQLRASRQAITEIREYLWCWLDHVTGNLTPARLVEFGFTAGDAGLLLQLLQDWQGELSRPPAPSEVATVTLAPIAGDGFPVLDYLVQPRKPTLNILTELTVRNGYALVSRKRLADSTVRVAGSVRGSIALALRTDDLPAEGANLANDLGLKWFGAPVPYMVLDKLFTPNLTLLTQEGLSKEWQGLAANPGQKTGPLLFPFKPEILKIVLPGELAEHTQVKFEGQSCTVTLRVDNTEVVRTYSPSPAEHQGTYDETLRDKIDVRLFPNFDLRAMVHDGQRGDSYLVLEPEDRRYYVRIRSPFWDFGVELLAVDETGRVLRNAGVPAWRSVPQQNATACAQFLRLDPPQHPVGVSLEDRGLCLCHLRSPLRPGVSLNHWEVGVDFGTTNTCVAYTDLLSGQRRTLQFPALTSLLLRHPLYNVVFSRPQDVAQGEVCEWAAALIDFFTRGQEAVQDITEGDSFPTQFLTQQPEPLTGGAPHLQLRNGLIYFGNVSLDIPPLTRLIARFPTAPGEAAAATPGVQIAKPFHVRDRLKWPTELPDGTFDDGDTIWREPFMIHLRKAVVLAAASRGARVTCVRFSHPRALPFIYANTYGQMLRRIWAPEIDQAGGAGLVTESEAVRNWLITKAPQNEHVVLDIGGGTTDVLALFNGQPFYQASVLLAGSQINNYVLGSSRFRETLLNLCEPRMGKEFPQQLRSLLAPNTDPKFVQHAWFALLRRMEHCPEVMNGLRDGHAVPDQERSPVRGFFLSLSVLFTGLAFLAGRLMRLTIEQSNEARQRGLINVDMQLLGNGARFYEMLTSDAPVAGSEEGFGDVMMNLFRAGLDYGAPLAGRTGFHFQGIPEEGGAKLPKALVALGLLHGRGGARVPVASNPDDARYYQQIQPDTHRTEDFPEEIKAFLLNLDRHLPQGCCGQFPVVPFRPPSRHSDGNLFPELEQVYRHPRVQAFVTLHEVANADRLQRARNTEATDPDGVRAVEGLFAARLRGLLHGIHELYGGADRPQ